MDYQEMIRRVRKLDFIRDEQTADAAVKKLYGILAGRVNGEQVRTGAGKFPEPFVLENGNGDQKRTVSVSVAEHLAQSRAQFDISIYQARTLLRNVLYYTKEVSGAAVLSEIGKSLPNDWAEAIQKA